MARQRRRSEAGATGQAGGARTKQTQGINLPLLQKGGAGRPVPASKPKERPRWQDPLPKLSGGFPPLTSTACLCADCRRIRPERRSWPSANSHNQLKHSIHKTRLSHGDPSFVFHTSSSTTMLPYCSSGSSFSAVDQQCMAAARSSLLFSDRRTQQHVQRPRPMGATSRLSRSLYLPTIQQKPTLDNGPRNNPMFRRPSNRPITVPKPIGTTRQPQLTTRLPPVGRLPGQTSTCEESNADLKSTFEVEDRSFDDDEEYLYDVESFCSEALSGLCSEEDEEDLDIELVVSEDTSIVSQDDQKREVELTQLQDFARWAKRFGGGAQGLSVASFLQEWRDMRRVGGNESQSQEVRQMAERLMNGEAVMDDIIARHVPNRKSEQNERLEQIERIRRDLVAMRQRRALQQQESAIKKERQRGHAFHGLGQYMAEPVNNADDDKQKQSK